MDSKQLPEDAPAWAKQAGRQIVPAEHAPRLELCCSQSYSGIRLKERDNDEAYIQMDTDDWVKVEDY
jgi:hypothetical protein